VEIYIDRAHCELCQSYCDRHVAKLVRFPEHEDRPCITALEDDGLPGLTLVVENGAGPVTLALSPQDREVAAFEGLSSFLN
jgi:hypothetical protein